ncbi:glycosyltransferase [uncultured Brachyspira sp.]|uniref:glycosyltransferase n=1 Tax=uncultured Brachyspira sp. TaxID=221953 RepID=UPI002618CA6F|nr:glycosyltransferase [uncultured Brachyspira sp.]
MEKSFDFVVLANKLNIKTFVWLHSCFDNEVEVIKAKPTVICSVSNFVKKYISDKYKIDTLIFRPQFYFNNTEPDYSKREYVTFINPVPQKGCDFVLKLAAMIPNTKFLCVEGWYKNLDFLNKMPNNITYLESQNDMNYVWSVSKVLIIPSIVQDASPRVIVEANINYIPVIGNNVGGIPEVMNSSGYIINISNIEKWIETINFLLNNTEEYLKLSKNSHKASLMFKRDFVGEFLKIIENY